MNEPLNRLHLSKRSKRTRVALRIYSLQSSFPSPHRINNRSLTFHPSQPQKLILSQMILSIHTTPTFSSTSVSSPPHKCHTRSRSQSLCAFQAGTSPTPPTSPASLFFDPLHPTRIPLSLLLRFMGALSSLTPPRCAEQH